jgi:hypothetical protein
MMATSAPLEHDQLPPLWAAGGSQLLHEASPEASTMNPNVSRRIAQADGWIPRPTCPGELIQSDLQLIAGARARAGRTGLFTIRAQLELIAKHVNEPFRVAR